ncbi:TPA: hypothetical protein ACXR7G_000165 [Yersinia enterocolitica]
MARNDSFNQPWASVPAQFERPGDGLIARGWAGGASEDPPEAKWENWWHNRVDLALQELQNLGQLIWFTDAPYQAGARVNHGGNSYIALSENTGVEPTGTLDTGVWRKDGASTYLQTANNLAEIAAAGPEAIAEAQSDLNLAALLGDALQKKNNLSEIAAAGSAAQTAAQANIGLTPSKFSGRLLNTQVFASTGTYTPTAGTGYIIVEAVGGGGASGAVSGTSASQNAITSVGSPGAYAKVLYTSVPSTASVVIGSGGVGIFGTGPTGGATTFGSILTCPGGTGSVVGNAHIPPGGTTGQSGSLSPTISGGGSIITLSFGQLNNPSITVVPGIGTNYVTVERTPLGNYGAGASGQFSGVSQVQKVGSNGVNGYLIVWEYSA